MKVIGGFLGLEPSSGRNGGLHAGTAALASGRACWHQILQLVRPRRVLLPFYICDAALEPVVAMGLAHEFYAIDEHWLPGSVEPRDGDLLLAVNYFGLLSDQMNTLVERFPGRVVVDDTQAFFRRGAAAEWSFNSARKFFGVPDGGYLFGPVAPGCRYPPSTTGDCDHLTASGGDDALRLYREHESRIGIELRAISGESARLLAAVDAEAVQTTRRANYLAVHARLASRNQAGLGLNLDQRSADVPLCYPFLPDVPVPHASLWARRVFVPQYWPELASRHVDGFLRERRLAAELLPLPIDQRYSPGDMSEMCDRVVNALAEVKG